MKKLFVILIICLLTYSSYCQDTRKNSIYVEALGNGILYSINYERLFPLGEYVGLITRIGFAYDFEFFSSITIPLEISGILGKKHCFELGAGYTFILNDIDGYLIRAGYRYRAKNGFLIRVAPMILIPSSEYECSGFFCPEAFPWIGISIGYSF